MTHPALRAMQAKLDEVNPVSFMYLQTRNGEDVAVYGRDGEPIYYLPISEYVRNDRPQELTLTVSAT